ncbi:MAG: glycine/sarcosine/betaine reductase selenoprotein B family protein [Acidobacteriota bacterium]
MKVGDATIRSRMAGLDLPDVGEPAFVRPPTLAEATVAVVTSAGLQRPGDDIWKQGDQSFRQFNASERDLTLSHVSNNFDRSGFVADLNVVYPLDRLDELATEGVIGAVSSTHLSFMGALDETMSTLRHDTGPAAAEVLKEAGTDVVLLTPV